MLVEQRTYTTHPGKAQEYFAIYEAEGLAIQQRILGRMVGYYTTEIGELNQIIHMWAYTDLNERAERRAALMKDPDWQRYISRAGSLVLRQESKILLPAPFFKPQWQEPRN